MIQNLDLFDKASSKAHNTSINLIYFYTRIFRLLIQVVLSLISLFPCPVRDVAYFQHLSFFSSNLRKSSLPNRLMM